MALLATQAISSAGLAPAYVAAAAGGDTMTPSPTAFLHAINASGGSLTVTLAIPLLVDGTQAVTSRSVVITAGTNQMIAVSDLIYRQPSTGLANITYSGVTSLTVAAIQR